MSTPQPPLARWRKSSHSGGSGGQCVEVAGLGPAIAVRDSKNPDGAKLTLRRPAFRTLTDQIRSGLHDL